MSVCWTKEITYNSYESQRTEEPKEQKKISVFPDFEEEFVPKLKTQETDEDVSSILLQIAEGFQKLAQKLK